MWSRWCILVRTANIWRDDIFSVQTSHSVISVRDLSLSDTAVNPIGIWSLASDIWSSYHEAFCVIISWTRTISWNIKHFAKPVGSTANKSPPDTSCHIASFLFFSKIRNQGEPTKYRKLVMMLPSPLNRFFPHYFDWRVLIKMTIPCQSEALFIHKWVLLPHTTAFCSPHSLLPNQNSPEMNGNASAGWQNICICISADSIYSTSTRAHVTFCPQRTSQRKTQCIADKQENMR